MTILDIPFPNKTFENDPEDDLFDDPYTDCKSEEERKAVDIVNKMKARKQKELERIKKAIEEQEEAELQERMAKYAPNPDNPNEMLLGYRLPQGKEVVRIIQSDRAELVEPELIRKDKHHCFYQTTVDFVINQSPYGIRFNLDKMKALAELLDGIEYEWIQHTLPKSKIIRWLRLWTPPTGYYPYGGGKDCYWVLQPKRGEKRL